MIFVGTQDNFYFLGAQGNLKNKIRQIRLFKAVVRGPKLCKAILAKTLALYSCRRP